MEMTEQIAVLIPSLSPDEKLLQAVKEIRAAGFSHILIVNDGSDASYQGFFEQAEALGAVVVSHTVNQGKGRALKTGINEILQRWPECKAVVTADSDGQHKAEDMVRCAEALATHPDRLVLGCRTFERKSIPFRSRFGNVVTSMVMKVLTGIAISDTQTGLRAFSETQMRQFLSVTGERFEYEMNMLLYCKEQGIGIYEVPIQTIYLEGNKSSHFRPLQDSARIYGLFLRYLAVSLSSFFVDILLFTLFTALLKKVLPELYILAATALARVVSSLYNFFLNRKGVFQSKVPVRTAAVRYYLLAVAQMLLSAGGVWGLYHVLPVSESLIKVVVDCILFIISFQIQREWVFAKKKDVC